MKEEFCAKVKLTIKRYNMLQNGDTVIVGLSGGADSVALFSMLLCEKNALGIHLAAAHVNHGLRGEEADSDAEFVAQLCKNAAVPLYVNRLSHPNPAEASEEWARDERYAFFNSLAQQHNAKIALAHSLSDNAETVLFNAVRGSGPKGLAGIPPVRGVFIRPMLEVSRAEVEQYCKANNIAYVTDSTNLASDYSRNRLRNKVMPQLQKVHPGAQDALARIAQDMRDLDIWLDGQALQLLKLAAGNCTDKTKQYLPMGDTHEFEWAVGYCIKTLLSAPQPLQLYALAALAGPAVTRPALSCMQAVLRGEASSVQLPGGKTAYIHNKCLFILPTSKNVEIGKNEYEIPIREGIIQLPQGYCVQVCVEKDPVKIADYQKNSKKGLTFVADYDRITWNSVIRTRRQDDTIEQRGRGVTKSVKKWMNEEGILPCLRQHIPFLAHNNRVLWMWGNGFSEGTGITENTRAAIVIWPQPCNNAVRNKEC